MDSYIISIVNFHLLLIDYVPMDHSISAGSFDS